MTLHVAGTTPEPSAARGALIYAMLLAVFFSFVMLVVLLYRATHRPPDQELGLIRNVGGAGALGVCVITDSATVFLAPSQAPLPLLRPARVTSDRWGSILMVGDRRWRMR